MEGSVGKMSNRWHVLFCAGPFCLGITGFGFVALKAPRLLAYVHHSWQFYLPVCLGCAGGYAGTNLVSVQLAAWHVHRSRAFYLSSWFFSWVINRDCPIYRKLWPSLHLQSLTKHPPLTSTPVPCLLCAQVSALGGAWPAWLVLWEAWLLVCCGMYAWEVSSWKLRSVLVFVLSIGLPCPMGFMPFHWTAAMAERIVLQGLPL